MRADERRSPERLLHDIAVAHNRQSYERHYYGGIPCLSAAEIDRRHLAQKQENAACPHKSLVTPVTDCDNVTVEKTTRQGEAKCTK